MAVLQDICLRFQHPEIFLPCYVVKSCYVVPHQDLLITVSGVDALRAGFYFQFLPAHSYVMSLEEGFFPIQPRSYFQFSGWDVFSFHDHYQCDFIGTAAMS